MEKKNFGFGTPIESKITNSLPPPPPQKLLSYGPTSLQNFRCPPWGRGGMDIFWNYTFNNYITIGSYFEIRFNVILSLL